MTLAEESFDIASAATGASSAPPPPAEAGLAASELRARLFHALQTTGVTGKIKVRTRPLSFFWLVNLVDISKGRAALAHPQRAALSRARRRRRAAPRRARRARGVRRVAAAAARG